jgi:hypothetical protein
MLKEIAVALDLRNKETTTQNRIGREKIIESLNYSMTSVRPRIRFSRKQFIGWPNRFSK